MNTESKVTGLRYWMLRVLEECDNVAAHFTADPVHDLRVSLRRCRSMADGMMAMDPDRNWKAMKKGGKYLFQRLGALRDVQVMMEWVEKLNFAALSSAPTSFESSNTQDANSSVPESGALDSPPNPAQALLQILQAREAQEKREARAALESFDRKQWRRWSNMLPRRAARIRPGSTVFKHLALERWEKARELHTAALRNRSQVAFHMLRIGIKRFRYIVENFLLVEHEAWSADLKHMQDLLGEVHDFDVLWTTAQSCHIFSDEPTRRNWHERITQERTKRVDEYRQRTVGPDSLWGVWRAGLPQGRQIEETATRRMKLWARVLDPDFAHSERVARLSLQVYDGLLAADAFRTPAQENGNANGFRRSLYAAALLHDVGKSEGNKGHHKESQKLIRKHGTPLGWNEEDMRRAALVARFHRGALPVRRRRELHDLPPEEQAQVIRLAAILRLANALDCGHDGRIRRVRVELPAGERNVQRSNGFQRKPALVRTDEALVITAEGYADGTPMAQTVAAERYLLETVLRRPVIVRPWKTSTHH